MHEEAGDSTGSAAIDAGSENAVGNAAATRAVDAVLVCDYVVFRDLLVAAVATRTDVRWLAVYDTVDGDVTDGAGARPDVVLVDTDVSGSDPAQLLRSAAERWPGVPLVALTRDDRPTTSVRLTQAGCAGLLTRTSTTDDIAQALKLAGRGIVLLSTTALDAVRSRLAEDATPSGPGWRAATPRERDVLERLLNGEATKEIAAGLHMSVHTCRSHVRSLIQKFGARSQVELVARASAERRLG